MSYKILENGQVIDEVVQLDYARKIARRAYNESKQQSTLEIFYVEETCLDEETLEAEEPQAKSL